MTVDERPAAAAASTASRCGMQNGQRRRSTVPGSCSTRPTATQQSIAGTITSAQGASAGVSSPFAAAGCATLPFKPQLHRVHAGQDEQSERRVADREGRRQGPGEANIHKVDLQLPLALPSRLTTLQKACTEAQFDANPAGCPDGSVIGIATVAHAGAERAR